MVERASLFTQKSITDREDSVRRFLFVVWYTLVKCWSVGCNDTRGKSLCPDTVREKELLLHISLQTAHTPGNESKKSFFSRSFHFPHILATASGHIWHSVCIMRKCWGNSETVFVPVQTARQLRRSAGRQGGKLQTWLRKLHE